MSEQENFGVPQEDEKARIARLRARAEAEAASKFDEEAVYAQLLAEAMAKRQAALTAQIAVDLPVDTNAFPEDYTKVFIFRGQGKQDLSYVPMGINGLAMKVPRDEEVILPTVFVTECLEHAIEDITVQSYGGLITRSVHRFPFNIRGKATKEEYQAFQKANREKAASQTRQAV